MERLDDGALDTVRHLFDPAVPNHPMLFASLTRRAPSVAIVDRMSAPTQCVLRTHFGPTFVSRNCDVRFVAEAMHELRNAGRVQLVLNEEEDAGAYPTPDRVIARIAFTDLDPRGPSIAALVAGTPEGMTVRPMSPDLLARCRWRGEVVEALATEEAFHDHGLGSCLMQGHAIASEAYALFWGEGTVEIGAITAPAFRGRGLAPITCAHLVQACGDRGFRTYWSCHASNPASQTVARKLGYGRRRPYVWVCYDARTRD
ncbi:MAG: GNAT family N-acetyltransferase [Planctomycetota bacterium]|jgi:GNAT superfamily N-acetyltransferase